MNRKCLFTLSFLCASTPHPLLAQSVPMPTSSQLVGVWVVTQNSKPTDTLREVVLQSNGDAVLKHTTMSFKRRWQLRGDVLTILPANDGLPPGPPEEHKVVAFDPIKKQLDIRNEFVRRDIRLVKSQ